MNNTELKAKIRTLTKSLYQQLKVIDKLPNNATRRTMIQSADKSLASLDELKLQVDEMECYFGFTGDCTGYCCYGCHYYDEEKL